MLLGFEEYWGLPPIICVELFQRSIHVDLVPFCQWERSPQPTGSQISSMTYVRLYRTIASGFDIVYSLSVSLMGTIKTSKVYLRERYT